MILLLEALEARGWFVELKLLLCSCFAPALLLFCSCFAPALGVTKFAIARGMILVTLCCVTYI